MKTKYPLSLLFFVCIVFQVIAQEGPLMKLEIFRHDFGRIYEVDGPVVHSFAFENVGTDTLMPIRLKTSSPNVKGDFVPEKVAPGKKGEIRVTFDPKDESGRVDKVISIRTNDVKYPVRQLGFIAEVVEREKTILDYYPVAVGNLRFKSTHVAMDLLKNTEVRNDTFKIYNSGTNPIEMEVVSAPEYTEWQCVPKTIKPASEGFIRVTYHADRCFKWGLDMETFTLKTNDSLVPEKRLSIGVNVIEDFSYLRNEESKPSVLFKEVTHDFGEVIQGQTVTHSFTFKNKGNADLIIRRTKANCGCTVSRLEKEVLKPGESSFLEVTYNSLGMKGLQNKSLVVICNDPDYPVTNLSFSANVVENK